MKRIVTIFVACTTVFMAFASVQAQQAGDYRTRNSGDWSNPQNWQIFNGASWGNIGSPPTGSETITVLAPDSIFVNTAVSVSGTLVNQGIVEGDSSLTFADGGVYQHDRDAGKIPISIWQEGSTLLMTGVTTTSPEDRDQDYHHITFNTPGLLSNLNMNLAGHTVGGDIRAIDTGFARWYLTSALATDTSIVTLMGDVFVENGTFATMGTSNAQTTFIVHHHGNIEVTGGNFSISRGSQPLGTTTWFLHEGNFSMSNATTQSSTVTPDGAKFVFAKDSVQTLTLGAGNTLTALPIEVSSGTTLDIGSGQLAGSGNFTVKAGATLVTSLAGGLDDIVAGIVATVTFEDSSSYGFNGTGAQVTSTRLPAVITDLSINNAAGVTLSQATTITGVLRLMAGVFDNTIPFVLGPGGVISEEGGSLLNAVTSVADLDEGRVPNEFFVAQNYPNPFNPSTSIQFGLPKASEVTVTGFNLMGEEVVTLFKGNKEAGVHTLRFDGSSISSGVYFYRIQAGDWVQMKRMVLIK